MYKVQITFQLIKPDSRRRMDRNEITACDITQLSSFDASISATISRCDRNDEEYWESLMECVSRILIRANN